jgi:sarcosine oxidase subunit gamma
MTTAPIDYSRRSFVYRILRQAGAHFESVDDAAIALHYGDGTDKIDNATHNETDIARRMGLADLSPLARTGYKGRGAPDWLRAQGLTLPDAPNKALRQSDATLVAALSWEEHLILGALDGDSAACRQLDDNWSLDDAAGCYQLPRRDSHCWFAVTGECVSAMLAKLCGVDLRLHKFPDGSVAQTSLARINGIVIRHDLGPTAAFYILVDSASGDYLWPCLIDAMAEFDGAPVGLAALRELADTDNASRR